MISIQGFKHLAPYCGKTMTTDAIALVQEIEARHHMSAEEQNDRTVL